MVDDATKALLLKLTGAVRELARHSTPTPAVMRALDEIDAELTALPTPAADADPAGGANAEGTDE